MKILNLVKTSVGGHWALRQMQELVRLGVAVHAVLPERGGLWNQYRQSGIRVHCLDTDFPVRMPWALARRCAALRRLVRQVKPDLLHSHFVGTTLTMRLALRSETQIPRIFQVPGPLHLENRFFRKAEIGSARTNDHWIATCLATRARYWREGVSRQRVHLSYYGTDSRQILGRKTRGRLRGLLGLAAGVPLVGMVAYLYPPKRFLGQTRGIKGHEDLIDAIAIASRNVPDLRVVFIGGAWNGAVTYERQVRRYAVERVGERALFLGTRSDVAELYADLDVAVHPSHSENLGGAVESLLMGVPTIATRVGGFPDIIRPGRTGYLVPPQKPDRLAETIVHVLNNPGQGRRFAARGREWVLAHCDKQVTARRVHDIYQRILSRRV